MFHQAKCAFIFDIYSIKVPWEVLWASNAIHEVCPSAKAVPADERIRSLVTSLDTFKGEVLPIKEEGYAKADCEGIHSYLWDRWVMDMYPLVFPHKLQISLEGLRVIYIR